MMEHVVLLCQSISGEMTERVGHLEAFDVDIYVILFCFYVLIMHKEPGR